MSVPTVAWDETSPAGSSNIALGDDRIREMKGQIRQVVGVDHDFPSSGSAADNGQHLKVTLQNGTTVSAGSANTVILHSEDASSKAELFCMDEDSNDIQMTSAGYLGSSATKIKADTIGVGSIIANTNITAYGTVDAGSLVGDTVKIDTNNTYITSKNAAGSGTVNLIKANASDKPVLPDGAEMATSGAPTTDAGIANKKYVDDTSPALGAWSSATSGTAATDILVCAYVSVGAGTTLSMSSGGTVRQVGGPASDQAFCGMMPVKSGDAWSVTGSSACFYIPLS